MEELVNIFIKAVFIENMVFAYFLGMCSYLAISKTVETSVDGGAVVFVLGITVPLNFLLETFVLQEGALSWLGENFKDVDLSFLSFIMFIAVIASMVQLVEMIIEKFSPCSLWFIRFVFTINCCELCNLRLFIVYARTCLCKYYRSNCIWFGFRFWILLSHCWTCCNSRENQIFKCSWSFKRFIITYIITGLMGIAFMSFMGIKL